MRILVVDDENNILKTTAVALETMGHEPHTASNTRQALQQLSDRPLDVAFVDLMLGKENGLDLLDEIIALHPEMPVVVFTAYSSIESAVEAIRRGAFDYIQKPFMPEQIRQLLKKVEKNRQLKSRVADLESQVETNNAAIRMESNEESIQRIFQMAKQAAASEANILLLGPSGTGKTVLARSIHEMSNRRDRPFVTVHCPSLSRELLESELFGHVKGAFTGALKETWGKVAAAEEGSLFLDEIGEIPDNLQSKLLRLLQEREYERVGETKTRKANVRLIAATNQNLEQAVEEKRFREDLYYRLNVVSLTLPPLSERPRDIIPLAQGYLDALGTQMGKTQPHLSKATEEAFLRHSWPGNMRELRNVIERALIFSAGDEIDIDHLPEGLKNGSEPLTRPGHDVSLQDLEEEHIRRVLNRISSMEQAAKVLGIDTATLYRKRKRLGLLKGREVEESD